MNSQDEICKMNQPLSRDKTKFSLMAEYSKDLGFDRNCYQSEIIKNDVQEERRKMRRGNIYLHLFLLLIQKLTSQKVKEFCDQT
jgi:hypothetical protein